MNTALETPSSTKKSWGPYQLRPNPLAILRLSLGTAAAISSALLIPDIFALLPSSPDAITLFCKAVGLWGYAYVLWTSGFLCILHLLRLFGGCILLDAEGIKLGMLSKRIPWQSIVAIAVAQRKIFSRVFFIPAHQMTIHIAKPDGKRTARQLASFLFLPQEFFSLFYYISKFSTGAQPQSINAFVFKDVTNPDLKKIAEDGRLKSLILTVLIAFGLVTLLGKNAVKNYSFNMGNKEFCALNYDKAIAHYSVATALEFTFAPAWDRLARCEFRQGDLDAAEADWQTALRWKPDYVESKLGLSAIYMLRGKLEEADKLIGTANRLAPLDEAAYINRAQIDILTGKTRLAINLLEQFVRQKEGRDRAICLLSQCYIKEGQLDKARATMSSDAAPLSNPFTKPFCTMVLAELKFAEGNTNAADKLLKSIRLHASHQPDLLIDLARMDILHKDFASAHRKLDAAAAINPNEPWIALLRAKLSAQEHGSKTDYWLAKAMEFRYADPGLMAACADFLGKHGKKREAMELAKKALRLDPYNLIAERIIATGKQGAK